MDGTFNKSANDDAVRMCELEAAMAIMVDKIVRGDVPRELMASLRAEYDFCRQRLLDDLALAQRS